MIYVSDAITLSEKDLHFNFVRSSGPGGQHVNKVSTAVQLRFDVRRAALPEHVKKRLLKLAGQKVTEAGILVIDARRFRSQTKNRQDALDRLVKLLRKAEHNPKLRIQTRPPEYARAQRLREKRHRSKIKQLRRKDSATFD